MEMLSTDLEKIKFLLETEAGRLLREMKGLSQSAIEKRTGIKREYLSKVENGDLDNPTLSTIRKLAQGLEVSICRIFETEDFSKPKDTPVIKILSREDLKGREQRKQIEINQYLSVPILDSTIIAKGLQYIDEEKIEGYALVPASSLRTPSDRDRYRCLRIPSGDKRMSSVIMENSLVCIDTQQRDPYELVGSIVVLRNEEETCSINHLRISGNSIVGIPENISNYTPLIP